MSHISTTSDHYLRYAPEIETPQADEAEAIDGIIEAMTHQSAKVADREKHAIRASHAKSTRLVTGTLGDRGKSAAASRQGVFASPRNFDVAVPDNRHSR